MTNKLTKRQEAFVREYLVDLNGFRAAIRAGYSKKGADVRASELLGVRKVRDRIDELLAKRSKKLEIEADSVLKRLATAAFFDIGSLFDQNGMLLPAHQIPEALRSLVNIEISSAVDSMGVETKVTRIKGPDKLRALEMLGRHLGMFKDKLEISAPQGLAERLAKAKARLKDSK